LFASSTYTATTLEGLKALAMYRAGSRSYLMISIFSPPNSDTMFWTLNPRGPTQAPTESTFSSVECTDILERAPASRAIDLISTTHHRFLEPQVRINDARNRDETWTDKYSDL
jgi:hypothetical protein